MKVSITLYHKSKNISKCLDQPFKNIIVHVCVSSSFIILVTSLLLLYILHQYNHHCRPIQAIDQGLHHTELVCNNYTGDYPIQVEMIHIVNQTKLLIKDDYQY